MVGNGVDREIPPGQVVHERHAEFHHRMTPVRLNVLPERRDLVRPVGGIEHRDGAVLDADRHRAPEGQS